MQHAAQQVMLPRQQEQPIFVSYEIAVDAVAIAMMVAKSFIFAFWYRFYFLKLSVRRQILYELSIRKCSQ